MQNHFVGKNEDIIQLLQQFRYPHKKTMQNHFVDKNEDIITHIINEFCIPVGLPWHMFDEVYVSVYCGKEFYWVLAVIVLKERVIRMYDSLSSTRKRKPPNKIQKFTVMLSTYLSNSDHFEKIERTD
ncbi:hypothetical protein BC332_13029 [Capsicum chinense]|nr:hypothetical protein BC332_13029 [Capsicum chinense]